MKKLWPILIVIIFTTAFNLKSNRESYRALYFNRLDDLDKQQKDLLAKIRQANLTTDKGVRDVKNEIELARLQLKNADIWLRYLEPVAYKKINGPLPVEWENEVFEKFEKPYKREGAGLSLAEIYMGTKNFSKDSLVHLVQLSEEALITFRQDSITRQLDTADHFFLCNRLYLLNLAAIYTTGFECPGNDNIIPELKAMLAGVAPIYAAFNESFPATPLTKEYTELYERTIAFVNGQPANFEQFDHFTFIKDYVNPLFAINQKLINQYGILSNSFNDYTLNNNCNSIFDKSLYMPQNSKGIYSLVDDKDALSEIRHLGKLLFYDPILSGNNKRSCVSCHKPTEYFTDTSFATSLNFDGVSRLPRNTPTLINVVYNHLLMLDGKHISLQDQGKDVMTNPKEVGGNEKEIVTKVMSCKEYKDAFKKLLKYTPEQKEVGIDHIVSAITYYYEQYSEYYAQFDEAMNNNKPLGKEVSEGFNLFMSKAQCATCHYVPQFNGVPPPYIGSEFEVLGVPEDSLYHKISEDRGRYIINPASETSGAFRTGSIRNAEFTKPYMHNGVFTSLGQVIDFYDAGGAAGRKMNIANQTLSSDSLKLTRHEKDELLAFIHALNENIIFQPAPDKLPSSSDKALNGRKIGGDY